MNYFFKTLSASFEAFEILKNDELYVLKDIYASNILSSTVDKFSADDKMIADCGINFFIFFKPSSAISTNVILLQVLNIFAASFPEPTPTFIILSSLKLSPIGFMSSF